MTSGTDQNEQFEQVLNRLDALMKRGQAADTSAPPAPPSTRTNTSDASGISTDPSESPPPSDTPFVILEEPVNIPVLTEVYDGEMSSGEADDSGELAEAVIDALMPLMLENLDIIVAEEAARMQQNIAERLRGEIAATLRNRLPVKRSL